MRSKENQKILWKLKWMSCFWAERELEGKGMSCREGGQDLAGGGLIPLHHLGFTLRSLEFGCLWGLLEFRRAREVAVCAGGVLCVSLRLKRHRWTPGGSYNHTTRSG